MTKSHRWFLGACLLLCFTMAGYAQQVAQQENPVSGVILPTAPMLKGAPSAAFAQWSSGAPIPVAKKYHTVAAYDGNIYVFGGVTAGNTYNAKCYKYNIATNTWTPLADFPLPRFLFGTAQTINGKIYITAGLDNLGTSYKAVADMYEYNPATDTYTKKTGMPKAQAYCASGVIDNRMYLIAGSGSTNTSFIQTVQVYDPATDTWAQETDYPKACRYNSATSVDNSIVVAGGYNNTWANMYYTGDVYVGKQTGGQLTWTKVRDYPIGPVIYVSSATAGGKCLFFGGRPSIDNNAPATQRSFTYEASTDTWTTVELKPTGMQAMLQAGGDGNKVYAPGGEDANGNAITALEIFDTQAATSPVLYMTNRSVDIWAKIGGTMTARLPMKNNGTAALTWSATVNGSASSWLSLQKASGTLPVMASEDLTLVINATGMPSGDNNATVTLTTNDPGNATVTIPVLVHAQAQDVDAELRVFIEEFSGTWCGWCPDGVDSLHTLIGKFGDRINIVTYHNSDAMATAAGDTITKLLNCPGFPSAAFNRILFPGASRVPIYRDVWVSTVDNLLTTRRSPVSISVTNKRYNPVTKDLSFHVDVFAHQTVTGNLYLSVIEAEDSLNYTQTRYNPTRYVTPYYHENAVRLVWPNEIGSPLTTSSIVTQNSVGTDVYFTSRDSVAKNSNLIIVVHRANGRVLGEVLQSYKEGVLTGATAVDDRPAVEEFALSQNYPNPFNPSTTMEYSVPRSAPVSLTVTDTYGRLVATLVNGTVEAGRHTAVFQGDALPSGTYYFTMRSGSFTQTRMMTLVK
jgi:N-acetylneuraminic acid mutarotase